MKGGKLISLLLFLSSFSLFVEIDKLFTLNDFFEFCLFLMFNILFISVGVVVSA